MSRSNVKPEFGGKSMMSYTIRCINCEITLITIFRDSKNTSLNLVCTSEVFMVSVRTFETHPVHFVSLHLHTVYQYVVRTNYRQLSFSFYEEGTVGITFTLTKEGSSVRMRYRTKQKKYYEWTEINLRLTPSGP